MHLHACLGPRAVFRYINDVKTCLRNFKDIANFKPEAARKMLTISYLSRFVIICAVADRLGAKRTEKSLKPRIFSLAGPGVGITGDASDLNVERTNDFWAAHMDTVAGNEAIVLDRASRYAGINSYGLNPGVVKTDTHSHFLGRRSTGRKFVEGLIGMFFGGPMSMLKRLRLYSYRPILSYFRVPCSTGMGTRSGPAPA
jgi:hypothetical protein